MTATDDALNDVLDEAAERIRLYDLMKVYAYFLNKNGKVEEIKQTGDKYEITVRYEITICYETRENSSGLDISWYRTAHVTLRPKEYR